MCVCNEKGRLVVTCLFNSLAGGSKFRKIKDLKKKPTNKEAKDVEYLRKAALFRKSHWMGGGR